MNIAVTGATGFLGRYIVNHLTSQDHHCRCWHRPRSNREGFDTPSAIEWTGGDLSDEASFEPLCNGADAVVHSALYRPDGLGFRASGQEAFEEFIRVNLLGTLSLMTTARRINVPRFVFISTCAVHEIILDDRKLDESHPLWATSHYGAHKAAVEKFVHSFGFGEGWDVCAVRPTGIYGAATPPERSRWFDIIRRVAKGESFSSDRGGKEVHAADVARAVGFILNAKPEITRGQAFNCYDQYISERHVAEIAKEISGSKAVIGGVNNGPKNQIETGKIRMLGFEFGGEPLLRETIQSLVKAVN